MCSSLSTAQELYSFQESWLLVIWIFLSDRKQEADSPVEGEKGESESLLPLRENNSRRSIPFFQLRPNIDECLYPWEMSMQ